MQNFVNETDLIKKQNDIVTIKGEIEVITYHNDDNGYTVLKIHPTSGYDGELDLIPLTCVIPTVQRGEEIEVTGTFYNHPKYGLQLKVQNIKTIMPDTKEGILAILSNGFLPHVGKVTATKLVNRFGTELFKILDSDPQKILEIKGITKKKYNDIIESYNVKKRLKDILEFGQSVGIGVSTATKIYQEFGDNSIKVIKKNPYQLIERIRGISFKKADDIALKMGIDKNDDNRIKAGLNFVLTYESSMGHCGYPKTDLLEDMSNILNVDYSLSERILQEQLDENILIKDTIGDKTCIFNQFFYNAEQIIANKLMDILYSKQSSVRIPQNLDKSIAQAEQKNHIHLATSQKEAVKQSLLKKINVITGGPGVGKTTIIKTVIDILVNNGNNVMLAAPTGRAAKRMKESTGYEAKTIHRLLEINPETGKFEHDENNLLEASAIIIDETSMVDTHLMYCLIKAIPATSKLILVGDIDQLPSVGAGQVLNDIISSETIPVSRLTEIFRQAKTSKIIINAHDINNGRMPSLENNIANDFFFVEANEPDICVKKILKMVQNNIPKRWGYDSVKDIQILSPMKSSAVGTEALNKTLQYYLNPNLWVAMHQSEIKSIPYNKLSEEDKVFKRKYPDEIPFIHGNYKSFAIGDKVMQIKNDYNKNVFNGDVGYIENIYTSDKKVEIIFEDEGNSTKVVEYTYEELNEIVLAYACTVHKSQGSEYPVVIIPMMKQHFMMLQRKLLYTGVTRGKKIVILVGQKEAIRMAVQGKKLEFSRFTKLKEWLISQLSKKSKI